MDSILQDLRYGLRMLRKDWGVATAATLTLGLGIGMNMAIFSLVDGVLFKPLPGIREPDRLVALYTDNLSTSDPDFQGIPYPDYRDYLDLDDVLSGLATYVRSPFILREADASQRVVGEFVSGNYFSVLGVAPALGRLLQPSDDHPAAPPAVVIGHRLWTERFGSDPNVLGMTITLDYQPPLTVVGVAPRRFRGPLLDWYGNSDLDVFVPISTIDRFFERPFLEQRSFASPMVVGRLQDGVTLSEARAALSTRAEQLEAMYPETNEGRRLTVLSAQRARFWPGRWASTTRLLTILSVSMALLLLVVCFNLANLLLARVFSRQRELAVRLAIGATRSRLVRQWLVEALLLVVVGGVAGALVATSFLRVLAAYPSPFGVPLYQEVQLDGRTLGFAVGLSLFTCLAFGLAPALSASRSSLLSTIKAGGHGATRGVLTRQVLIIAQVAVSVVILIGAGIFGRSLYHLLSIDPGFAAEDVLSVSIDVRVAEAEGADLTGVYLELLDRFRAIPGVDAATIGAAPLRVPSSAKVVTGEQSDAVAEGIPTTYRQIAPGYFETFSIAILQGRDFMADRADNYGAVIVDQAMAEQFWPADDALGQQLKVEGEDSHRRVVGVVTNVPFRDLWEAPDPHFYLPVFRRDVSWGAGLAVRAAAPQALTSRLRQAIRSVSAQIVVIEIQPVEIHLRSRLSRQRLLATLAALLGVVALALVTVGIFGLLSFVVNQRTREIAIRIALGAEAKRVGLRVMIQTMQLTILGVAAGVLAWISLGSMLEGEIYGIGPTDPVTIILVVAAIMATTMLAAYWPVRRVTRVDPMVALRAE